MHFQGRCLGYADASIAQRVRPDADRAPRIKHTKLSFVVAYA